MQRTLNIHGVEIEAEMADGLVWLEADSASLYAQKQRVLDVLGGALGGLGPFVVPLVARVIPDVPPAQMIDWERSVLGTSIRFISGADRTRLVMSMSAEAFTTHLLPYAKE